MNACRSAPLWRGDGASTGRAASARPDSSAEGSSPPLALPLSSGSSCGRSRPAAAGCTISGACTGAESAELAAVSGGR
eukprot:5561257-Prymnesium_polylepis.1